MFLVDACALQVEDAATQVLRWLRPGVGSQSIQQQSVVHLSTAADGSHDQEDSNGSNQPQRQQTACDAVFCDANKHPAQSAQLVLPLLPFLKPGALIVITMKCRGRGR